MGKNKILELDQRKGNQVKDPKKGLPGREKETSPKGLRLKVRSGWTSRRLLVTGRRAFLECSGRTSLGRLGERVGEETMEPSCVDDLVKEFD